MSRFSFLVGWIAMSAISASAFAQEYKVGNIRIDQPYARPTVAAQTAGVVYVNIENLGQKPDQLVSVTSTAAKNAELHTMSMQNNVMKMREVPAIEIRPAEKIVMTPGHGYHIMLIGLKRPLMPGDKLPISFRFKNAGVLEAQVPVENKKAASAHHHH